MKWWSSIIKSDESIKSTPISISDINNSKVKNDKSETINYKEIEALVKEAEYIKENIIKEARDEAELIKKEAYYKAYEEGLKNGYEDGYEKAYLENVEVAKEEGEKIRKITNDLIISSKNEIKKYLDQQEEEILKTCINIASKIVNKKIEEDEYIINLVKKGISEYSKIDTLIIKCNEEHKEVVEEYIYELKLNSNMKEDIFVIVDNMINKGNIILEKDDSKINLGIEGGLERIKLELLGYGED
ncbi:MAG: FliH/SctL family protein [Cetobacterium sp.]